MKIFWSLYSKNVTSGPVGLMSKSRPDSQTSGIRHLVIHARFLASVTSVMLHRYTLISVKQDERFKRDRRRPLRNND